MADYFTAGSDLISGIGDFLGGQVAASADKDAAAFYQKAAGLSTLSAGIQKMTASREIGQLIGQQKAAIGASGLAFSGSAKDIAQSTAQQGGLTQSLIALQGNITTQSYLAQAQSAQAEATAKQTGGIGGLLGDIVSGIGAIFSDDRLKLNIEFVRALGTGINVYRFQFTPDGPVYEGALASEVEEIMPEAITHFNGYRMVNYDMLGVKFREVSDAAD